MAGFTGLTYSGTLRVGKEPQLDYTEKGEARLSFSAVENVKDKGEEAGSIWYDIAVYGSTAENAAASISKGSLVVVAGPVKARWYNDKMYLSIATRNCGLSTLFDSYEKSDGSTYAAGDNSIDEDEPF